MGAVRNLYINGIETSSLKLGDSGLRLSAVKRSIHGTGANDQRNPLESLRRIVLVAEAPDITPRAAHLSAYF